MQVNPTFGGSPSSVRAADQHNILWRVMATSADAGALIARLALGIVMFPHGMQKLLGWFGGQGFGATMGMFTSHMHVPAFLAVLAILAEGLGSLGLLTGLLGRIAAFGVCCNMVVAVSIVHVNNGFFMNWMGNQKGEGFEYHLLAIGLALVVMVRGSGMFSLDRWITTRETTPV